MSNYNKQEEHPEITKLLIILKSVDGGTGTFAHSLIKLSKEKGVNIKILVLEKPSFRGSKNPAMSYFKKSNFYPQQYKFSLNNIHNFLAEYSFLKKNIKSFLPDVVLGVDVHANLLVGTYRLFDGSFFRAIFSTHNNLGEVIKAKAGFPLSLLLKFLVFFLYNRADILVCTSNGLAKNLKKEFRIKQRIQVIYYGIASSSLKKKDDKSKIVITVGRLVEQKDYKTLMRAFATVSSLVPGSKLWIVGDGPLKKDLKKLSAELNLDSDVRFLGWSNNISKYLKQASIFVLSSKREGFGYVILEAMAYGLPIVSTNSPFGPSEILDRGKYGILVPVSDTKALAKALLELIKDKGKRRKFSKLSLIRVKDFSEDRMLSQYSELIKNLL